MAEDLGSHITEFGHHCLTPSHESYQKFTEGPSSRFPT